MLVLNDRSRPYRIVILRVGALYGYNDCLINQEKSPLIEFWDMTDCSACRPQGSFVQRYHVETLMANRRNIEAHGMEVWKEIPTSRLDGNAMVQVYRWLAWQLGCNLGELASHLQRVTISNPASEAERAPLEALRKLDPSSCAVERVIDALDQGTTPEALGWLELYSAELRTRRNLFPIETGRKR